MILSMLIVDVVAMFGIIKHFTFEFNSIINVAVNSVFVLLQFLLKAVVSYVGHSTTCEGEEIKVALAKATNNLPVTDSSNMILNELLIQFETRNLKLQNIFFSINWNVLLTVSCLQFD